MGWERGFCTCGVERERSKSQWYCPLAELKGKSGLPKVSRSWKTLRKRWIDVRWQHASVNICQGSVRLRLTKGIKSWMESDTTDTCHQKSFTTTFSGNPSAADNQLLLLPQNQTFASSHVYQRTIQMTWSEQESPLCLFLPQDEAPAKPK